MPGTGKKRWHFDLFVGGIRGIGIIRGGKPIADSKGRLLGAIVNLSIPTSLQGQEKARAFSNQALQVIHT